MRTILRKALLLSVMTVFAIGTVMAQPRGAEPVIPGSKGKLPALNTSIPQALEGHFGALAITEISTSLSLISGDVISHPYADLSFFAPQVFGGEYYTLEHRQSGSQNWETVTGDNYERITVTDDIWQYETYHTYGLSLYFDKEWGNTDYRLILHGGDKDGWVSNEVTAIYPGVFGCKVGGSSWDKKDNLFVGMTIATIDHNMEVYTDPNDWNKKESYTSDSPYYKFSWYRRNPNTFEMTPIPGATSMNYTTTLEDLGYEIVGVTQGDDQHLSFYTELSQGICQIAIQGCPGYVANDFFVLNTDYILPNGGKEIGKVLNYGAPAEPFDDGVIEEVKPGQYLFHLNIQEMMENLLGYTVPGYQLAFVYDFGYEDETTGEYIPNFIYREAQIIPERYMGTIQVKPLLDNETLATTIDIFGKMYNGQFGVVATLKPEEAVDGVFATNLFKGNYYLKARQANGVTLDTYFPDALVWSDASFVETEQESWEEDWQPTINIINMVKAPEPLQGSSVIEGTITVKASGNAARRTRADGGEIYTVYLKAKATGNIIAQTQTDANGNYRFENVPVGDYLVVPNVDGYKAEGSAKVEVKVTEENQTITNADCTVTEVDIEEIFPGPKDENLPGDANGDGYVKADDIAIIVDYLLGKNPQNFSFEKADINKDKVVNIADILQIVNIILNK